MKKEEWYCGNCGSSKKGNTVVGAHDRILTCLDCCIVIRFYVMSPAKKTEAQAAKSFNTTPLTESQEFGSKAKYGRKKKK